MPLSPKKQMQQIIEQSISMNDLHTAYEALIIYRKAFANDDFTDAHKFLLYDYGPQVSVIALDCSDDLTDNFIDSQKYHNIEIVRATKDDSYNDIIDYMKNTTSKYICFIEKNHQFRLIKLPKLYGNLKFLQIFQQLFLHEILLIQMELLLHTPIMLMKKLFMIHFLKVKFC